MQLVSRDSLKLDAKIDHNSHSAIFKALADSGADAYIIMDIDAFLKLRPFGVRSRKLVEPIAPRGFNGSRAPPITHTTTLTITVDGYRQARIPIMLTRLGNCDIILGRLWFEEVGALIDCKNRCLHWPTVKSQNCDTPKRVFNSRHLLDTLPKMERALRNETIVHPTKLSLKRVEKAPDGFQVAAIGGAGFHRHMQSERTEVFISSLQEIEHVISEIDYPGTEAEETRKTVPKAYHDYIDVFSKKASDTLLPYRDGVDCRVRLEEKFAPGYCPLYKMSREELEFSRQYIYDNIAKGFIVPSTVPFASPILVARKPDGSLRFCVDFRKLNAVTKKDGYPLPLIDELMQRVGQAKYFTKLDIRQGFHRIRMTPESEDLTSFRTRYGQYKYTVMPFGITNGPATFQRYINSVLKDCLDIYATVYVDDILIYSETLEDYRRHIRGVLERLRGAGLQAALHKCEFHVTETKFLGFIVGTNGIRTDPDKIAVIQNWDPPTTVKGI